MPSLITRQRSVALQWSVAPAADLHVCRPIVLRLLTELANVIRTVHVLVASYGTSLRSGHQGSGRPSVADFSLQT